MASRAPTPPRRSARKTLVSSRVSTVRSCFTAFFSVPRAVPRKLGRMNMKRSSSSATRALQGAWALTSSSKSRGRAAWKDRDTLSRETNLNQRSASSLGSQDAA